MGVSNSLSSLAASSGCFSWITLSASTQLAQYAPLLVLAALLKPRLLDMEFGVRTVYDDGDGEPYRAPS